MRHLPQGWMKNWRTNWFPIFVRRQSLWNDFRFAILCCSEVFTVEKYRKLIFDKYHILLYQVKDQVVYVEYVIDGRQDYQWLLTP